jgi:hypothetical protein
LHPEQTCVHLLIFSPPVIKAGSLHPDTQHIEFAFLELNPEMSMVDMLVQLADTEIRNEG